MVTPFRTSDAPPSVSIIVPCRNEKKYIAPCLESLIKQDYSHIVEILVVDGMSEDGTRETVKALCTNHPTVKLLDNSRKIVTTGLNIGIAQASGDIIVRADAHAMFEPDYVRQCVECMQETGAANVGGHMRPVAGRSLVSTSIGFAHQSRFGIGVARFHRPSEKGWADTVWLGAFPRHVFHEVGLYNEDLPRSEDIEFNARLRAKGYKVYLSPQIRARYYPRNTLFGLWKQNFANGKGIADTLRLAPRAVSARHLVPLAFVLALLGSGVLAAIRPAGFYALAGGGGSYLLAALAASATIALVHGSRYLPVMLLVFATIHLSYGLGSLWGLLRLLAGSARRILRPSAARGQHASG